MIDNKSIAIHAFPMGMLISLSFDAIWLPRYMSWSSDVLQSNVTHGHTSVDRQVKTYIHWVCTDTGCHIEDLKAMTDWDEVIGDINSF